MTKRLTQLILAADVLVLATCFVLAYCLRYADLPIAANLLTFATEWWPIYVPSVAIWTILYFHMRLDGFRGGWQFPAVLSQLTLAVALMVTLMLAIGFLERHYYPRLVLMLFGIFTLFGTVIIRCCARSVVLSRTRSGAARKVVILGDGHVAREFADNIERHPELMLQVDGFLYPGGAESLGAAVTRSFVQESKPVSSIEVLDLFRDRGVEELIVALPDASSIEARKLIGLCRRRGIHVSLLPQWYELYVSKARLMEVGGLPMVSLENHSLSPVSLLCKRIMDLALGSLLLVVACPLMFLISASLLVRRGKALKYENRCGRDGRPFRMYRFNIPRENPAVLVGHERLLVELSLTELPQLWNVLKGDMALIGPRPEPPDRVRHYSDWQHQRLIVPPGLTGLAQVSGLREQHSSEEKARFDVQYIHHWSPFLDLSLILQTVWTLALRLLHPDRGETPAATAPIAAPVRLTEVVSANSTHSGAD